MIIQSGYFTIFNHDIPFYGLLFVAGFFIAILVSVPKAKRLVLPLSEVTYSAIFAGIGGVLGAKLLSVVTSVRYIIEYEIPFVDIIKNGFVFYGGLIGGIIGLFVYAKSFGLPLLPYLNLYTAGTALGHAFGRIGCLFSGCCYGVETSGAFFIVYRKAIDPNTPLDTPLLPVQLIESMCLIVIFFICEALFYGKKTGRYSVYSYLILYPVTRFILEFFRGDLLRGFYAGFSTSQYISVGLFLLGLLSFALQLHKEKFGSGNKKLTQDFFRKVLKL